MLGFQVDDQAVGRMLTNMEARQLPFATMMALNDTAKDALDLVQRQMDIVFDRPKPFTRNAFHVWRATKDNLTAEVKERTSVGRKHFLKVQERGGARPQTGLERSQLASYGLIAATVPAAKAKRDAFGNWSAGERRQALAGIGTKGDSGSGKKRVKRSRATYFIPEPDELSPGIWRHNPDGSLDKIALFTGSMPTYRPRLQFAETAQKEAQAKFPAHFARRFREAFATAR